MENLDAPRLSVIIPAYNEEPRIGNTLENLQAYFRTVAYAAEIIVVNDGSTDRTAAVADGYAGAGTDLRLLHNPRNMGKGFTVRHGMLAARGRIRLFFDADGSTPIDQVEKFWPHFDRGAAICIGSRALAESRIVVHQPKMREAMGRVFNGLVRLLVVGGFSDTQCGFKAFTAAATQALFSRQRRMGFGFDVELLYIAKWLGLPAVEVPVDWYDSPASRVHPWRDAKRMLGDLLAIRWNAWRGHYD